MLRHFAFALIFSTLCFSAAASLAQAPATPFEQLQNASRFAPGGVSIDGHRPEELFALDQVAEGGTAELERLFREASATAGKLYALLGLYTTDRPRYGVLSTRLNPTDRVMTQLGCMRFQMEVRDALQQIEGGHTLFPRP